MEFAYLPETHAPAQDQEEDEPIEVVENNDVVQNGVPEPIDIEQEYMVPDNDDDAIQHINEEEDILIPHDNVDNIVDIPAIDEVPAPADGIIQGLNFADNKAQICPNVTT